MTLLETPRLVLREWTFEDLPAAEEIYGDPEVMHHVGDGLPHSPEVVAAKLRATLRRYRRHGTGMWCLVERGSRRILGHCGLQRWEGTLDVELGFLLRRDAWGFGFATEAGRAVLEYGFEKLRLERIVAVAHPENERSLAVMRRLGMTGKGSTTYKGREGLVLFALDRGEPRPSGAQGGAGPSAR